VEERGRGVKRLSIDDRALQPISAQNHLLLSKLPWQRQSRSGSNFMAALTYDYQTLTDSTQVGGPNRPAELAGDNGMDVRGTPNLGQPNDWSS